MSDLSQRQHVFSVLNQMQDMILTLESHVSELEYDMDELDLSSEWGQIRGALTGIDETLLGVLPGLKINLDENEVEEPLIDMDYEFTEQFSKKG